MIKEKATTFRNDARAQEQKGAGGSRSKGTDLLRFPGRPPSEGRQPGEQATDKRILNADRQPANPYFSTAIEGWIETTRKYKKTVPNWPLDDSLLHRHLSTALLAQYDYWWNSLFLQMGAFAEPLFYPDASMSASYGGLGFLVARNIFKAFDFKRGSRLDSQRQRRDWMSPDSRASYERKIACTAGNDEVLAHVAALEIAFTAFFGSTAETGSGGKGQPKSQPKSHLFPDQSETMSAEVVFFLVYCRALCGDPLGCGDVLKHVAHFGRAFQCPENSTMTSLPGCTFFAN
ncbi:uncharacterized protein LOC119381938 [Rhipicephalus sanguineus]|uniref:uncharacterized protein LOC119381938 n=1 Tax=Rhipicephalus sanguineus TaxID=34632 RepID=UPI001894AF06|nr:uncharacterized protein LOC119381938 [Rhipicephalus sanguineus]